MGGGEKTVQTTTQDLSPEQRQLLEGVIPIATDILKPGAVTQYPGSGIAPQNENELGAQAGALNAAGGMSEFTSQIPQMLQQIMGGQAGVINQTGAQAATGSNDMMSMIRDMLGQTTGQINSGNAATDPALATLMNPDILDASSNPHLQSYMDAAIRPLQTQYSNVIMPGIAGDAITAGGYGGSRQGIAEGLASSGLSTATGDTTAKIASEGYGQGLTALLGGVNAHNAQQATTLDAMNRMFGTGVAGVGQNTQNNIAASGQQSQTLAQMMQTLAGSPDVLSSMTRPAEVQSAVGEAQRADEQARLSEQVQRFTTGQMLPFSLAQQVAQMAFGMPGGTTTSTGQTSGGSSGLSTILGGVSALPALLGLFGLSDRRLKENIKYVRTLADGLRVYTYNFIGQNLRYLGLMADEVQKVYPQAVIRDTEGWLRLNYHAVPTWTEMELL